MWIGSFVHIILSSVRTLDVGVGQMSISIERRLIVCGRIIIFLVSVGLAGFKVIAGGVAGSVAIALAWGINLSALSLIVLIAFNGRLNKVWRRLMQFKRRTIWWRKEAFNSEIHDDNDALGMFDPFPR